ncbi:ATP-binding protein (plasmid) [Thermanaerothrix sp. 4228-RoL]|jgi:hypothetical protein|uniref:ATP-binding protein n=3 Tax=Thermanaerothrix TaxID=1077886 RepID=A0ABU3NRU8_9CHLR|nr:DUF87 domain-containing protein [Thermanaerothrix sp. 4228-RoL]MDT8899551.1 ATP-binding protein [Thermanaerothrix sp. 4228-RoL]
MIFSLGTFDHLVASPQRFYALSDLLASLPRLTSNGSMRLLAVTDHLDRQTIMDGFHRVVTPDHYLPPGVMAYRIAYEQHLSDIASDVRFVRLYLMIDPTVDPSIIRDIIEVNGIPVAPLDHELKRPFATAVSRWEYLEGDNGLYFALLRSRFNQYGVTIYPQILHGILALDAPVWVGLQVHTLSAMETTRLFQIKRSMLVTSHSRAGEGGHETQDAAETLWGLQGLIRRGEALHTINLYVLVGAPTPSELHRLVEVVRASTPLRLERYYGAADIVPQLFSPSGQMTEDNDGTLVATTGAALLSSSLLSYRRRTRTDGVLLGVDRNQAPVVIDLFDDKAASYNTVILGQTGSGKTFSALVLMMRHLLMGTRLIIVDPQGNIHLDFIDDHIRSYGILGQQGASVNVLERVYDELGLQVEFSRTMLRLLGIHSNQPVEQALLDEALVALYEQKTNPLMMDLLQHVEKLQGKYGPVVRGTAEAIALGLRSCVYGSRAGLFGKPTDLDLSLDAVVNIYDISRLPMQGLGGNLRSAFLLVLLAGIQRSIRTRREQGDTAPILMFVDEMGILMRDREAAAFVSGMFKTARSSLVGMIVADQDLHSLLGPADEAGLRHGVPMLANAANVLIFRQKESELEAVREHFPLLPETLVQNLPLLPQGTCVASFYDGDLLVVSVLPSRLEEVVFSSRLQDRQRARELIRQIQQEIKEAL